MAQTIATSRPNRPKNIPRNRPSRSRECHGKTSRIRGASAQKLTRTMSRKAAIRMRSNLCLTSEAKPCLNVRRAFRNNAGSRTSCHPGNWILCSPRLQGRAPLMIVLLFDQEHKVRKGWPDQRQLTRSTMSVRSSTSSIKSSSRSRTQSAPRPPRSLLTGTEPPVGASATRWKFAPPKC
jgi:hypothetical protein